MPGYGESDPPPTGTKYTTQFLMDTLAALLEVWRLDQVSLVGLSMGGATALGYAIAHPGTVSRLVLVDSYGLQDHAPWQPFSSLALALPSPLPDLVWGMVRRSRLVMWAGLSAIFHNPLRLRGDILEDARHGISLEYFYDWLASEVTPRSCRTNFTQMLTGLHVPVLLVHGQHDPSIPLRWAKRAAELLPAGYLAVIPGCGHWPNRERPDLFNAAVLQFLIP